MTTPSEKGVIYRLEKTTIAGKKDPSAQYDKYLLTLEQTTPFKRRTDDGKEAFGKRNNFPQFEAFNIDLSSLAVGDFVEVFYQPTGRFYTGRDGKEHNLTKLSIVYVTYADMDDKGNSKTHKKEHVPAKPQVPVEQEMAFDETSDLPF